MIKFLTFLICIFTSIFSLSAEENFLLIDGLSSERVCELGPHLNERISPCSTFKIVLSLIGFDSEILQDEMSPCWPFQEGYDDFLESWKTSQTPLTWIKNSCIWYSKVLAMLLGEENLFDYLVRFKYGNQDISGGLTNAWINSSLQISPVEQVKFIQKMVLEQLPITSYALHMTKSLLFIEEISNGWKLFGKTGWSGHKNQTESEIAWFVGWFEKDSYFFPFAYQIRDPKIDLAKRIPRVKQLFMESYLKTLENNITHTPRSYSIQTAIHQVTEKIRNRKDLPYISVERQLELVDQLAEFALGRFLLERSGLNGFWIDYIVQNPTKGRITGLNSENKPFSPLEAFLLNQAPTAIATQERFAIFKTQIQKKLTNGMTLASIPCGLMADLLDLNFTNISSVTLTGIDLDPESIAHAKQQASTRNLKDHCRFFQKNAWDLDLHEEFDLITSNGLTIYESNDDKVLSLYQTFFEALKPGGYLVTSFLTPPPNSELKTEWKLNEVNLQDALL